MKKRVLSLALAVVLAVSLLPGTKAEAAGSATGQQIVDCAMQYLGKVPYVWGGTNIDGANPGADCSGFICRIYEKFGFNFWGNRTKLRNCGTNLGTDLSVAQLGDIIWYSGHVAIYAGKSNGSHMIVHETGGSFQNVVYTKASLVSAELKGVIRIPGVINSGSTVTVPAPNVKFTLPTDGTYTAKQKIASTNAVVVNQITKPSGVKVTKMGVILYDASGSQIKKYSENVSNVANSTTTYHSWYDMNTEVGITLTPGTTYKYQFFGVFNGVEVKGGTYSFTTTGTAPVKTFTATFYLNESCSAVGTKSVTQGKTYGTLPDAQAKEGHTFDGWYTAATGGTKITDATIFNGSSDVTLYPRYTKNADETVTIHFYMDGKEVMTQTAEIGSIYGSDYFEKDGYTFTGWYSSETGGTRYDGSFITATSPRTLYARYELTAAQQHTVFLYANGSIFKTLTVTNGETYGTLPTPSLSDYTFDGWYTAAAGGVQITGSTTVNLTAAQTLYARFSAVQKTGGTIVLQIGNAKMTMDGVSKAIDEQGTVPVIRNNRTLLPVRAVFEAMGGTVGWDNASRVVSLTKDGKTLYLGIDNALSWDSKGRYYTLDSAPVILNNRTMLPIRFVVEYFGGSVSWNDATRSVIITYNN